MSHTYPQAQPERRAWGTCCNHLFLRGSTYWWRRRISGPPAEQLPRQVARSLRTKDPALARTRARACSVAFDHVMIRVMRGGRPTREELKRVLDDIFHRILDDGERTRAARAAGPPPWTPEPFEDPRYDDLEPEDWDKVPYPPELWMEEWRVAVMCNDVDNVRPLLDDALAARNVSISPSSADWQRICRLSLVVAAQAHAINAKREWGDYSNGWPNSAGVPLDELPGLTGPTAEPLRNGRIVADNPALPSIPATTITESCTTFFAGQLGWSAKYRKQAAGALLKFVSLNGDLPVDKITGSVTEAFRTRLKEMPRLYGKSIYAGQSPLQAHTTAVHLRSELAKGSGSITLGKKKVPREQGERLSAPMSMNTVNREFSVFTSWGKWMKDDPARRRQLDGGNARSWARRSRARSRARRRGLPGALAWRSPASNLRRCWPPSRSCRRH